MDKTLDIQAREVLKAYLASFLTLRHHIANINRRVSEYRESLLKDY